MERHFVVLERSEGQGYGFALYYDEETDSHRVRHIQSGSIADQPNHLHVGDCIGTCGQNSGGPALAVRGRGVAQAEGDFIFLLPTPWRHAARGARLSGRASV